MRRIRQFKFPVLLTVGICLSFAMMFLSTIFMNISGVYAQQKAPTVAGVQGQPSLTTPTAGLPSPLSSSLAPKLHAVKITSPLKGQQIPVGRDLTITGTSMDDATSATSNADCQVIIGVNQVKPYQPAIPAGSGGAKDYSKWNFILTSKYTTIKPGPTNKITAKYTCTNSPGLSTYSSVNVTGVPVSGAAALPVASTTKPITRIAVSSSSSSPSPITSHTTPNANIPKPSHIMSVNNATILGPGTASSSSSNIKNNNNTPISSHITPPTAHSLTTTTRAVQNKPILNPIIPTSSRLNIKIASPTPGQQVSAGKNLTMTGISSDNAATGCKVYAGLNSLKPYQPAIATGPQGAADYSTWRSTYTPPYRTITNGINKITAELSCNGNPMVKYDTLNITGVPTSIAATTPTTPQGFSSIASNSDPVTSSSSSSSSSSDNNINHHSTDSHSTNGGSNDNPHHSSTNNHISKSSNNNGDSSGNTGSSHDNKITTSHKSSKTSGTDLNSDPSNFVFEPTTSSDSTHHSTHSHHTKTSVDSSSSDNSDLLDSNINHGNNDQMKSNILKGFSISSSIGSSADNNNEQQTSSTNGEEGTGGVSVSTGSTGAFASAGDTSAYAGSDGVSVSAGGIRINLP
jgi:hypothetical protein